MRTSYSINFIDGLCIGGNINFVSQRYNIMLILLILTSELDQSKFNSTVHV